MTEFRYTSPDGREYRSGAEPWHDALLKAFLEEASPLAESTGSLGLIQWTPPVAMTLHEISSLLETLPRIPKRELRCHPDVTVLLRNFTRDGEYAAADEMVALTGAAIFEAEDMPPGAWKFLEDGVTVKSGNIYEPGRTDA